MIKIRNELKLVTSVEISDTGDADIIQNRADFKYHEVHIYRLLYKWRFISRIPEKRFLKEQPLLHRKI